MGPPCFSLSILRYGAKVGGAIQRREWRSVHLGVVAFEKGAFGSLSSMVAQLIYIYIYMGGQKIGKSLNQTTIYKFDKFYLFYLGEKLVKNVINSFRVRKGI